VPPSNQVATPKDTRVCSVVESCSMLSVPSVSCFNMWRQSKADKLNAQLDAFMGASDEAAAGVW